MKLTFSVTVTVDSCPVRCHFISSGTEVNVSELDWSSRTPKILPDVPVSPHDPEGQDFVEGRTDSSEMSDDSEMIKAFKKRFGFIKSNFFCKTNSLLAFFLLDFFLSFFLFLFLLPYSFFYFTLFLSLFYLIPFFILLPSGFFPFFLSLLLLSFFVLHSFFYFLS